MGERKVVQKYYPPDFDPSLLARAKGSKKRDGPEKAQYKIRFMMPMSVRCLTCGEYIYRGKKFNARKETVQGETYLGIKIFRFYVRCPRCSAEFTIKTDPEDSDYIAEAGCTKNFEPWKDMQAIVDEAKAEREEEEKGDATKVLENRAKDSKREMDILEALEDIRHTNARGNLVTHEQLWEQHLKHFQKVPEEDESELQKYYESREFVRRLSDDDDEEEVLSNSGDESVEAHSKRTKGGAPVAATATSATSSTLKSSSQSNASGAYAASSKAPEPATTVVFALPSKKVEPVRNTTMIVVKVVPKVKPAPASAVPKAAGLSMLSGYGSD